MDGGYPDLRSQNQAAVAIRAQAHLAAAAAHEQRRLEYGQAAAVEKTDSGVGINAVVQAHLERAAVHRSSVAVHEALHKLLRRRVDDLTHTLHTRLTLIDHETQQRAAAAAPEMRAEILAAGRAAAVTATHEAAALVARAHGEVAANVGPRLRHIIGHDIPADIAKRSGGADNDAGERPDPTSSSTNHDPGKDKNDDASSTHGSATSAKSANSNDAGERNDARPNSSTSNSSTSPTPPTTTRELNDAGARVDPPATGGGDAGIRTTGGDTGIGTTAVLGAAARANPTISGGSSGLSGLTGKLPAGGLGNLAGSGSPSGLSALASGGSVAGESAPLGGVSGAVQSSPAAVARSLGSQVGSAAVGITPPVSVSGLPAASAGHSAPPAAGVSGISPSSLSAGGSTGQVPPAAVGAAGSVGAGTSAGVPAVVSPAVASAAVPAAPPAMMVPAPGMAAPAAPVVPGTPVSPASAGGGAASSSGGGVPGGGVVGAGPGIVPAGVPIATSTPVDPRDSADLAAAKALAMQLRRDSDAVSAVMEWAVGLFRAEGSAAAETVVVGSQGAYIPWGVFVPRGVRLLWSDALTRNEFERWRGWPDPARVLAAYAELRAEHGHGRMVAAAATDRVAPLREVADESALCPPRDGARVPLPVLDAMHVDRWELAWPDLSARVSRLLSAGRSLDAVVRELAANMMHGVVSQSAPCPPALRDMWGRVSSKEVVSQEDWEAFTLAASREAVLAVLAPTGEDPEAREWRRGWQQQWLIARTMEVVSGWRYSPLPIGDMLYAASMAYQGDFGDRLGNLIRPLEAGWRRVCDGQH